MTSNIPTTTVGGGGVPGGSSGSSGGLGGGGSGPCGACKFLRRKCVSGCIFAPYFDSEQGTSHFAAVHKVFGASNVSKMLQQVPVHKRLDAVVTICYEAQARLRNPVYGCVAHIFALQQQVVNLQGEIACLQAHLANLDQLQPPPQAHAPPPVPHFSFSDLPTSSTMPTTHDLSSLIFDPVIQWPQPIMLHHNQPTSNMNNAGTDDQYVTLAIPQPSDHRGGGASSSGGGVSDHHQLLVRHSSFSSSVPSTSGTMHGSSSNPQRPSSQPK